MKSTCWIRFSDKLPYSSIPGRKPPYDFPVLVAMRIYTGGPVLYEVWDARQVTLRYTAGDTRYVAWMGITEYDGN